MTVSAGFSCDRLALGFLMAIRTGSMRDRRKPAVNSLSMALRALHSVILDMNEMTELQPLLILLAPAKKQ